MKADTNELIVLKRVEEEPEPKRGGVWKIAHADFMTAMMAFFLIMWLVNATDEEIKKSIANYFNPINLVAAPTDARGLDDPDEAQPPASGDEAGHTAGTRPLGADTPGEGGGMTGGGNVEEGNENRMDSAGVLEQTDGAAFHDPYATLSSAAADIAPDEPVAVDVPQSTLGTTGTPQIEERPRDPFDPAYWQTTSASPARTLRPGTADKRDAVPPNATLDAADRRPTGDGREAPVAPTQTAAPQGDAMALAAHASEGEPVIGPSSSLAAAILAELGSPEEVEADAKPEADAPPEPAESGAQDEAADRRRDEVAQAAATIAAELADLRADVTVTAGRESVLIALTDDTAFSMFPIGSAEPTGDTVALFASVAAALAEREGSIVVRGHTDARPFAAGTSDNWTLSFERAHATKVALVRNGIAEVRIQRVEGLADRAPRNGADPFADENRRIEILYEPAGEAP